MANKSKEKDFSTKLVNLAEAENFKVLVGPLGEEMAETAGMASGGDRFFDQYGSGKVMVINAALSEDERRVAVAQLLQAYSNSYSESVEFYIEIKKAELDPEKALEILIDEKAFEKRFKKHTRNLSYNDAIMTLSKEFMVKPSLVAKYARKK